MNETNQRKAYLFALLSVFFWSTVPTAFKIGLSHFPFYRLLLYSSLASLFALGVFVFFNRGFKKIFSTGKKKILHSAILGFLNPFAYYLVLLKAYDLLPAQLAQPLNMTWPIVLVFMSVIILKQKIRIKSYIALLFSLLGVIVLATKGSFQSFGDVSVKGVALAIGCAFLWSFYWIYNVKDKRDESEKLFLNFFFATFYIFILNIFLPGGEESSLKGYLSAAYIGFFEMGITFVFWLKAMKYTKTTDKISNLIYIAPFLSLFFIYFIINEKIYMSTPIGIIFIVLGIFIQHYGKEKV